MSSIYANKVLKISSFHNIINMRHQRDIFFLIFKINKLLYYIYIRAWALHITTHQNVQSARASARLSVGFDFEFELPWLTTTNYNQNLKTTHFGTQHVTKTSSQVLSTNWKARLKQHKETCGFSLLFLICQKLRKNGH